MRDELTLESFSGFYYNHVLINHVEIAVFGIV